MIAKICRFFGQDPCIASDARMQFFAATRAIILDILMVRPGQVVPICLDKSPHYFNELVG